jgi:hypothetical protein
MYNGMATPVKQFYTEASSTLRTVTGGSTVVSNICMLKGVTINAGAANCSIKIFDGSDNTGTLRYQFRGLAAANEVYQEYIAATGIKFDSGMYIEFQTGGGLGATTSVQVIWQ